MKKILNAELVKAKAKELGFDLVGITTAEPLTELKEILETRQKNDERAVFTSENIEERINPKAFFKEGKSVLMAALNYYSPEKEQTSEQNSFAKFARGEDYHQVMKGKLEELGGELKAIEPKLKYKIFVDTGPLAEKELAKRGGLGFIGKNSLLINPNFGSYLVLGGMVLNWELEIDQPLMMDCGACQKCIDTCPGKAILKPYQIDARRCLSYLTQKKGVLSQAESITFAKQVYGCDICQDSCPFNHKYRKETKHQEFLPQGHSSLKLEEILNLDKNSYQEFLGRTAAFWRGRNILKRNALIVLARLKKREAIPLLLKSLTDNSPLLRGQAALLLKDYHDQEIIIALNKALLKEKDKEVADLIKTVLIEIKNTTKNKSP